MLSFKKKIKATKRFSAYANFSPPPPIKITKLSHSNPYQVKKINPLFYLLFYELIQKIPMSWGVGTHVIFGTSVCSFSDD